jgi:hypothetical protein
MQLGSASCCRTASISPINPSTKIYIRLHGTHLCGDSVHPVETLSRAGLSDLPSSPSGMSLPLPQLVPPTSLGPDDFTDDEFLRPATRKSGTVFGLAVGVRALGNELSKWKLHSGRGGLW